MKTKSKLFPSWVWFVYAILLLVAIPWYLPASTTNAMVIGIPASIFCCIVGNLLAALFTLWVVKRF